MSKKVAEREAELKRELVPVLEQELTKSCIFRLEDRFRVGIPDISITWAGTAAWLEVKYADPDIIGRDAQLATCMHLAEQGICWYVIYERSKDGSLWTHITSPFSLIHKNWRDRSRVLVSGHDHHAVAAFIADVMMKVKPEYGVRTIHNER